MSVKYNLSNRGVPSSLQKKLRGAIVSSENYEDAEAACERILKPFRREPYYGGKK